MPQQTIQNSCSFSIYEKLLLNYYGAYRTWKADFLINCLFEIKSSNHKEYTQNQENLRKQRRNWIKNFCGKF